MLGNDRSKPSIDWGFWGIAILVGAVAIWLIIMPVVPAVSGATMRRFHLQNRSFAGFAIQTPIPAMYNFSNRWQSTDVPPDLIHPILLDPLFSQPLGDSPADDADVAGSFRHINHFPARVFTFGAGRHRQLREGTDRWIRLESRYRGEILQSRYHLKPTGQGGFDVIRLEKP